MYKIILIIGVAFCSNMIIAGQFAALFQPEVSRHKRYARKLAELKYPKSEEVIKALYANTLVSMKRWLEAKERAISIGSVKAYTMDAADNALFARVKRRAEIDLKDDEE